MRPCLLALLVLCLQPAWLCAQDGKLARVRNDVRRPAESSSSSNSSDDDDDGESLLSMLLGGLFTSSECDEGGDSADAWHARTYFYRYPYANHHAGVMWIEPYPASSTAAPAAEPVSDAVASYWRDVPAAPALSQRPAGTRTWAGRLLIEDSDDFDGLNRVNGQLLVESCNGLGLQGGWSYLRERLATGGHDHLWLGDVNVTWCFIRTERLQVRTGMGLRWLTDRDASDLGVNMLVGGDYFPTRPLVFSTLAEGGRLGNAGVFHARATVGFLLSRWEFFTGYDWLRIGSTNLRGPLAGLRLWF